MITIPRKNITMFTGNTVLKEINPRNCKDVLTFVSKYPFVSSNISRSGHRFQDPIVLSCLLFLFPIAM